MPVGVVHHGSYTDAPRPFQGRKIELSAGFSAAFRHRHFTAISGHFWAFIAGNCPNFVPKWPWDNWEVVMATIVARKGATGPSFRARVRLTPDGELIQKESKTFSTKTAAKTWA